MLGNEARNLLVDARERGCGPKEVARAFGVSEPTVRRLVRQRRETGSVELRTSRRGRKPALSAADLEALDAWVEAHPDATVAEANRALGLGVSDGTVRKAVASLGRVYKKKSVHACERERPRRR